MKIRPEQFEAFEPKDDQEIVKFIVLHLQEASPDLVDRIPPSGLCEMVANGLARARGHDLNSLGDLAAFVSIMFEIAPNFDEHPALLQALRGKSTSPDALLDRLFVKELDQAWEEVDRSFDPKAWQEAWYPELRQSKTGADEED